MLSCAVSLMCVQGWLLGTKMGSISWPEQEGLKHSPYFGVGPVLAQNVSWVAITINVEEAHDLGCHGFMYMVE